MKLATIKMPAALLSAFCCLLFCNGLFAQNNTKTIRGVVTSTSGEPLPGASIAVKGNAAIITKAAQDGAFSLTVPGGKYVLVVSYSGYVTREIADNGMSAFDIRLSENPAELSTVVVIGYGTARKSDLTGSVASVKADELKAVPVTSLDQALQGRAAGVQVTQNSGKPGAETSIRIRGTSSINAGNEPLYVIDGMLVSSDGGDLSAGGTRGPRLSPLSSINPGDLESIEILKDAS
ncbi:MAG: TonB-dependent receptor plug domain-containing protein, partial [Agriterribacter sp.]